MRASLSGERWRRQEKIRSQPINFLDQLGDPHLPNQGHALVFSRLLFLVAALCRIVYASILLEAQWLKLDASPCEALLVAAYGTNVPSHVLQYATFY